MVGGQLGVSSDRSGFLTFLVCASDSVLLLYEATANLEQSRVIHWQCQGRVEAAGAYQLLDLG